MKNWKYRKIEPGPSSLYLVAILAELSRSCIQPLSHWYTRTFLTFFLNICVLTREVPIASSGNRFQSEMVLFTKENFPTSVLIFLDLIFQSDQLYSGSMAPLTCPLYLSTPFHRYTLCREHTSLVSYAKPRVDVSKIPFALLLWRQ
jgi:hypothetical protein